MARFSPSYKGSSEFNGGEKYRNNIDSPSATDFNNVIENLLVLNEDSNLLHDNVYPRLEKAEWNINSFDRKLDEISETIEQDFSETKKKVENLYARTFPEIDVIDSSVAYQRIVPIGALPYAEVAKVGGMSHKSVNLIPFPYHSGGSQTSAGCTFDVSEDGVISVSCAKTTTEYPVIFYLTNKDFALPSGTYTLSGLNKDGSYGTFHLAVDVYNADGSWAGAFQDTGNGVSFVLEDGQRLHTFVRISADYIGDAKFTVHPMLNEGSMALPYSPYFEGLRHAKVTEIKSIGANLWDEQWENGQLHIDSGNFMPSSTRIVSKNYIPVDGEVEYHFSYDNNSNVFCCYDKKYAFLGAKYQLDKKFTTFPNTRYVKFMLPSDYGATYKNDIIINQGTEALPYRPYTESSLPIPSAVQALPDYGKTDTYIEWRDDGRYFVTPDEPINISHLLPDDNFIRVEGGGTITAVNEYGLAVPITINYQVD